VIELSGYVFEVLRKNEGGSWYQPATDVFIAVRDSGPGVDMKSLDRLFDAFYTTKSREERMP
jgi:signal transduction histidine kinase